MGIVKAASSVSALGHLSPTIAPMFTSPALEGNRPFAPKGLTVALYALEMGQTLVRSRQRNG